MRARLRHQQHHRLVQAHSKVLLHACHEAHLNWRAELLSLDDVVDGESFVQAHEQPLNVLLGDAARRQGFLVVRHVTTQLFDHLVEEHLVAWQLLDRLDEERGNAQQVVAGAPQVLEELAVVIDQLLRRLQVD